MDKIGDKTQVLIQLSYVVIARAKATLQQAERQLQRSKELVDQSVHLNPRRR